jgi:hypothetical protein
MVELFIYTLFLLLAAHWVADYPLQGDFLAKAKQQGPLRVYHLVAHAGIQGAAVTLVTGSLWLGLLEWLLHTVIDDMKVNGKTTFAQDQALHVICKVLWAVVVVSGAV